MNVAIEQYLRERPGWVSAAELTRAFNVKERELRSHDGESGLCTDFAISGNLGFKHVANATDAEWTIFEGRLRSHGMGELKRVKHLRDRRNHHLNQTKADLAAGRTFESTGQGLLLS